MIRIIMMIQIMMMVMVIVNLVVQGTRRQEDNMKVGPR